VEEVVVGVTQSVGLVDPTRDDLPSKQDTQVSAEDAPTTEEYFPRPHCSQYALPDAGYVPAMQVVVQRAEPVAEV
jgi:hypothetical protein